MDFRRLAPCIILLLSPLLAMSEPDFDVSGLNTQMTFADAISHAQALGGNCTAATPRRRAGGLRSLCYFSDCEETAPGANCEQEGLPKSSFDLAGQPVVSVEFAGPAEDTPLNSIALYFAGDQAPVLTQLLEQFGQPQTDTAVNTTKSWTESRRLMWTQEVHRVSLLVAPKMILMVADREKDSH
ncbi:MAG: hypothetical protein ACI9JM_002484 [Halioglobus sp.]|jgi:hypothetical protein